MSSQARIDANRGNAQKSTGPRTPEGKARSSRNALRHGLASISQHCFLAAEDRSAFERMLHGYMLIHRPQHADEVDLVTDTVFCKWRQQRLWSSEAQSVEMAIAQNQATLQKTLPKAGVAAHVAHGVSQSAEPIQLLRRYEAQLVRQYLRNLKELRELQAARQHLDSTLDELYSDPPKEPNPAPQPSPKSAQNPTPPAPQPPVAADFSPRGASAPPPTSLQRTPTVREGMQNHPSDPQTPPAN